MSRSIRNFRLPLVGTFAGAAAAVTAAPAMAASTFALQNALADWSTREWLLAASLLLLLIALGGRIMRSRGRITRSDAPVIEEAPDLRWWRSPMSAGY